jgi:DNA (cytosine-5)-methyltransferase 1
MWLHVPEELPEVTGDDLALLSLCSGGAMLDVGVALALETLTGRRVVCVGYCEREAGAAATLVARMVDSGLDSAPVWDDLASLPCKLWREKVAVVTAGIPCQPWSCAGAKLGINDPRWLWPLVQRAVRGVGARILVLENVPGFVAPSDSDKPGWIYPAGLGFVLGDLAEMGWDAEWVCVRASAVGAHHERWRVFLVAIRPDAKGRGHQERTDTSSLGRPEPADGQQDRPDAEGGSGRGEQQPRRTRSGGPGPAGKRTHGPDAQGRERRLHVQPGGSRSTDAESLQCRGDRPDAAKQRTDKRQRKRRKAKAGSESRSERCSENGAAEVSAQEMPFFAMPPQACEAWQEGAPIEPAVEPGLCVNVHGLALVVDEARNTQLRTSGNGVVALQAAVAVHEAGRRLGIG